MTIKKCGPLCNHCPLKTKKIVQPFGPTFPKLIVVGEGPGQVEAAVGKPFQGPSGRILRSELKQAGLDPLKDVYYANATMCLPPYGIGTEAKAEIMTKAVPACVSNLRETLQQFPTTPVVALGRVAQEALGIEATDKWEPEKLTGKPTIATRHPAYFMHSGAHEEFIFFIQAIRKAVRGVPAKPTAPPPPIRLVHTAAALPDIDTLRDMVVCVDIETNTTDWPSETGKIFLVGISWQHPDKDPRLDGSTCVILTESCLKEPETHAWLRALFAQNYMTLGGHNFKFDNHFLAKQFGVVIRHGWDTILMANYYHTFWYKDLKGLCVYYLDVDDWSKPLSTWLAANINKTADRTFDNAPVEVVQKYLQHDIHYNLCLKWELDEVLKSVGRLEAVNKFEVPTSVMVTKMEHKGLAVDQEAYEREKNSLELDATHLGLLVEELSMSAVNNPRSPVQVAAHLWDNLGLKPPVIQGRSTGRSTARPVLDALVEQTGESLPFVVALQAYRRVHKILTSYFNNLPNFLYRDKFDVLRVHPNYLIFFVKTGRWSARKPAIQTIPRPGDSRDVLPQWIIDWIIKNHGPEMAPVGGYGQRIKNIYTAAPGNVLVAVDGSQWELRTAAAWSGDPWMLDCYQNDKDIHGEACDVAFGAGNYNRVLVRTPVKSVIFGLIYGGKVESLTQIPVLTQEQKIRLTSFFYEHVTRLLEWREEMFKTATTEGVIFSPFFNRAYQFDFCPPSLYHDIRKWAVNYPVQGTAAMITIRAMVIAWEPIRRLGGWIVGNKHDEIIAEVPERNGAEAAHILAAALSRAGMEVFPQIPWKAEAEIGTHWGQLKGVEL